MTDYSATNPFGEQGWRNGQSACLLPMCAGFDSRTRRHMWIEFVVGSRPCSEGFSPGSPVFLPPQKPTFLNSNSIGNSRATGLSVEDCCVSPSLNKVNLFSYLFISTLIQASIAVCFRDLVINQDILVVYLSHVETSFCIHFKPFSTILQSVSLSGMFNPTLTKRIFFYHNIS